MPPFITAKQHHHGRAPPAPLPLPLPIRAYQSVARVPLLRRRVSQAPQLLSREPKMATQSIPNVITAQTMAETFSRNTANSHLHGVAKRHFP
jgi:hypothetical protein